MYKNGFPQEVMLGQRVIEDQIGYKFNNPLLLKQAFTRRSCSEEYGGENNEVLEFIGDKVLDIAVVRYLTERYGTAMSSGETNNLGFRNLLQDLPQPTEFKCDLTEGELTKLKQKMVQKKALASRIDDLELARFMMLGEGDIKNGVAQKESVKEDLFEAILGAVALDCNWNFNKFQEVVETMLRPGDFLEDGDDDYVSLIYEWTERKYGYEPHFKYFDSNSNRMWYNPQPGVICEKVGTYGLNHFKKACQVKLAMDIPAYEGYGETNNKARQAACRLAYQKLEEKGLLFTIRDEIENPNLNDAINQLEILARRGYFSIPEYVYDEEHDGDGNPVWHVECHIEEEEYYFESTAASKKTAKKQAAFEMLEYVLGIEKADEVKY